MDSEAARIRAEIDRTRLGIEQKLERLEARAHRLDPRQHVPDRLLDHALGVLLATTGVWLTWRHFRARATRGEQLRAALSASGVW
jgi:hypothetical protein